MKGVMMGGDKEAYEMLNMIRLGLIKPSISEVPLSHVPQCIQGYLNSTCVGKIVVRVNGELSQEQAEILAAAACSPEVSP
jgi:D-arabinose 1-dehydrogenase-like Zn-dependent alcohol dehydrogenase